MSTYATPRGGPPPLAVPPLPLPPPSPGMDQVVTYHIYRAPNPRTVEVLNWDGCWGRCFAPVGALLPGVLLAAVWASWIVFIAGTAYQQHECNRGNVGLLEFLPATSQPTTSAADCVHNLALLWWSVWLQFLALLLATAIAVDAALGGRVCFLQGLRVTAVHFAGLSTLLLFFIADAYNKALYSLIHKTPGGADFDLKNIAYMVLSGSVGCLIVNFMYIVYASYDDAPRARFGGSGAAAAASGDVDGGDGAGGGGRVLVSDGNGNGGYAAASAGPPADDFRPGDVKLAMAAPDGGDEPATSPMAAPSDAGDSVASRASQSGRRRFPFFRRGSRRSTDVEALPEGGPATSPQ